MTWQQLAGQLTNACANRGLAVCTHVLCLKDLRTEEVLSFHLSTGSGSRTSCKAGLYICVCLVNPACVLGELGWQVASSSLLVDACLDACLSNGAQSFRCMPLDYKK
jgi:hypothetical protein